MRCEFKVDVTKSCKYLPMGARTWCMESAIATGLSTKPAGILIAENYWGEGFLREAGKTI